MKNRTTLAAALAGVLAGTVIGAGTYYSAQLVSYRYSDVEGSREQYRRSDNSPTARRKKLKKNSSSTGRTGSRTSEAPPSITKSATCSRKCSVHGDLFI